MAGAVQRLREIEDAWAAKATQASIDAAKAVISENDINGRAMISSLNNLEWGWICSAAVFAWIKTKSQQAVAEGVGYDTAIRAMPGPGMQPWDQGAVEGILPALGDLKGVPWDKPLGDWSKLEMIAMAWAMYRLVDQALAARDEGAECKITVNSSQARAERELSAANGGPLLARGELNDVDIPF